MSRSRLISDATADLLLAGGEVDDPAVQDLAQVLAAASAPGRAEELMWENVAVAAFAAAHLTPTPAHRRRPMFKSALASALGLKLAAAGVAAVVGGLAFAASTGMLPSPLYPEPVSSITPSNGDNTPTGRVQPSTTPSDVRTAGTQLAGWCHVYLNPGSADEQNRHMPELAAAAGGADKVTDYCIALVGSPKVDKPKPSSSPHKPAASQTPRTEHSRKVKSSAQPSR